MADSKTLGQGLRNVNDGISIIQTVNATLSLPATLQFFPTY
ncbi:MAG: hypothetical protein ACERJ1_10000 [Halodesulfovibrio sp.]